MMKVLHVTASMWPKWELNHPDTDMPCRLDFAPAFWQLPIHAGAILVGILAGAPDGECARGAETI